MLGAIYTGLSGMNAYSKGLQTISNNVANLNTSGFKATTVTFTDLFSQGGSGLSYSSGMLGSTTGDGVRLGTPLIDFGQGDLRQSGNDLDLAIKGSGFLILLDGEKTYYMRTGSFIVDKDGYVAEQQTGHRLAVLDEAGRTVPVHIDAKRTNAPAPTTKIVFADNVNASATSASVSDIAVYDSIGGKQVWTVNLTRSQETGATGEWNLTVKDATGRTLKEDKLRFIGSIVDPSTATIVVTDNPTGANPLSVTLDFSSRVTSFSGPSSTLRAMSVDGNAAGTLATVGIDANGKIKLTYTNEKTELLGAVALADFRDPQQLERVGDGMYRKNGGNNDMRILASGTDGIGTLVSKQVEASNVNLSDEFGQLILIQRGFQASSQVVSITNDMIQQLFGIRGQG